MDATQNHKGKRSDRPEQDAEEALNIPEVLRLLFSLKAVGKSAPISTLINQDADRRATSDRGHGGRRLQSLSPHEALGRLREREVAGALTVGC
jgi:hypothetical protein